MAVNNGSALALASLSSWRAWIEIFTDIEDMSYTFVALLMESVD